MRLPSAPPPRNSCHVRLHPAGAHPELLPHRHIDNNAQQQLLATPPGTTDRLGVAVAGLAAQFDLFIDALSTKCLPPPAPAATEDRKVVASICGSEAHTCSQSATTSSTPFRSRACQAGPVCFDANDQTHAINKRSKSLQTTAVQHADQRTQAKFKRNVSVQAVPVPAASSSTSS